MFTDRNPYVRFNCLLAIALLLLSQAFAIAQTNALPLLGGWHLTGFEFEVTRGDTTPNESYLTGSAAIQDLGDGTFRVETAAW